MQFHLRKETDPDAANWWNLVDDDGKVWAAWSYRPDREECQATAAMIRGEG